MKTTNFPWLSRNGAPSEHCLSQASHLEQQDHKKSMFDMKIKQNSYRNSKSAVIVYEVNTCVKETVPPEH